MCGGGGGYSPPPPPPPPPPKPAAPEVTKATQDTAKIDRNRAGRKSTIMTSAKGLVGMENIQSKKLLGTFKETL
tara:strand:+ start:736 stop:957 length:222 start_codon:yes stop_codon:yes gene_type:complete